MKYTYDMHIHSALSPCAEEEMTPNNIVNMAVLNGLDIIAVTDHNSAGNLQAFKECSDRKGIVFVPGIEVESAEEVHIVCLFADVESACMMGDEVRKNLLPAENKPDIFGTQLFFDSDDNVTGQEEQMLLFASAMTAEEVFEKAYGLGGCAYFAHVDRASYSVFSALGTFPEDIDTGVVEVSDTAAGRSFAAGSRQLTDKTLLFCTDSHRLETISRGENSIELPVENRADITAADVISWVRKKDSR